MLRISIGGDAEGGWVADIHDGGINTVHRPTGENQLAALMMALAERWPEHFQTSEPAPAAHSKRKSPANENTDGPPVNKPPAA